MADSLICAYCKKRAVGAIGKSLPNRKTCGADSCKKKRAKEVEAARFQRKKPELVARMKARRAARSPEKVAADRIRDTERMRWYREGTEYYKKPKYMKKARAAKRRFYANHKAEHRCQDCSKPVDFYHLDGKPYVKCCVCRIRENERRAAYRQTDAYYEKLAREAQAEYDAKRSAA